MFEAYQVAVKLHLVSNVASGLAALGSNFQQLNQHVGATQNSLNSIERKLLDIKRLGMVGGAMAGAGFLGLSLFKAPLEEAAQMEKQIARFKLYGLGDAVTGEAVKFAKGMNTIGTSYIENMKLVNEAQGVFREAGLSGSAALDGAKLAAPMLAKIQMATESLDDESKGRMRTQSMAMLRFVEMRGGLSSASAFNGIADAGWKAIQSSGGNINWEQLRQFLARGGVAAQGLNNEALFGKMEPIIGELKGSTAGNALMTSYNRLVGGVKVPNQIAHLLADKGIWDASKIEWNSQGGIKRFNGNPLRDMATMSTDPVEFYEKNILPMYAKMGISSTADKARENTMIFGRTGGAMYSLIDRQLATIHHSVEAQKKALGVDASTTIAANTPAGKILELHAQWSKLLTELGVTVLPIAIKALAGLTSVIKGVIKLAHEFPTVTKALAVGFVILSGVVAVGGVALLATAAFKALGLALAFNGIGGAAGIGRLAASLAGTATGLGAIAKVGALMVAWEAGQWVGGKISDNLSDNAKDNIGRSIAKVLALFGNQDAQDSLDAEHKYVKPNGGRGGNTHVQVLLPNGKVLAETVVPYMAKEAQRPQAAITRFDPNHSPWLPGAAGGAGR